MQTIRYYLNVTLDGCYDHRAASTDPELHAHTAESIGWADHMIFGRVTYQMMESAWRPSPSGQWADWVEDWMLPFARTIDAGKKHVVSETLDSVDWNADLIRGDDLEATVRHLKHQPGRGIFVGGVQLAQALTELGLIDEYEFIIHPRVVGYGPTLFAGLSKPLDLTLIGRKEFTCGAVSMRYRTRREEAP